VILPKHLLTAATSGGGTDYEHLLSGNCETPFYTPEFGGSEFALQQLGMMLKLSVDDFKAHARALSSPDELSVYIVPHLMRQQAPSLLWITMHDIDIAHAGAFSLYIDGIRRTDRLSADVWKTIQSEPEYAGKTTLFILPDFGRDSDDDDGRGKFTVACKVAGGIPIAVPPPARWPWASGAPRISLHCLISMPRQPSLGLIRLELAGRLAAGLEIMGI
jgi:hypothetical protein